MDSGFKGRDWSNSGIKLEAKVATGVVWAYAELRLCPNGCFMCQEEKEIVREERCS